MALSYSTSLFLMALVSVSLLRCSAGKGIGSGCGKKCKKNTDCSNKLVCDEINGECTNNPVVPPVICQIPNCNPTSTFTYTNQTTSDSLCQPNSVYQLFSCSPPVRENNFAVLYYIQLENGTVACNRDSSHKNSEMLASLATGWFNGNESCFKHIILTYLHPNGSRRTAVAQVVDECGSTIGCSAETGYYEPCPPSSVGATKGVWDALGLNSSSNSESYITWGFLTPIQAERSHDHRSHDHVLIIAITSCSVALFLAVIGILIACWRIQSSQKRMLKNVERTLEEEIQQGVTRPQQFRYHTLQKATRGFNAKLKVGEGGFGVVHRGTLPNGSVIAVKRIVSSNQGSKQFKAEVMSIGSIRHLNLVKLLGFCIHSGQSHMLVYEYVANGSLDQWLFSKDKFLPWNKRLLIALDVARGLAYLHEGCREKVLHLDIKPQNILLDGNMRAKIADFGFSKLIAKEESHVVTVMRGTMGYMAPEWLQMRVTEKTDVYSFGMVILELACGRKCIEFPEDDSQEADFLGVTAFNKLNAGLGWELVDKKVLAMASEEPIDDSTRFNLDAFEKMVRIGLWCVQEDPAMRPTMEEVVKALENVVNVVDLSSLAKPASNASMILAGNTTSESSMGQISISVSDLAR